VPRSTAVLVSGRSDVSNPHWLNDIFAGLMVAVAAYSAGRLIAARVWSRPTHRDIDVAHILMGVSMAGQLVSDLNPISSGVWELVFSVLAGWFLWRCYEIVKNPSIDTRYHDYAHRLSRRLIHLTMALAMLYMYLAATPPEVGSGGSMAMGAATGTTADFVFIPMIFIFALLASAIWQMDAIGRWSPSAIQARRAPALASVGTVSSSAIGQDRASAMSAGEVGTDGAEPPPAPWLAPRLEGVAHIVMVTTMAYMLVLML
jgi:Domain of unknown function (DUF5134)